VIDIEWLCDLAREAGRAILDVYGTDFTVEQKKDRSPLTLADTQSHRIIVRGLQSRFGDIPILSEEGKEVPYSERSAWSRFWLVDPLDGTKEFVKRNDEFTVNIALIEGTRPVFGIIHLPVTGTVYAAEVGRGCWEYREGERRLLQVSPPPEGSRVRVVGSRSHASPGLGTLLELLPSHELMPRGSALKFCAVAAGEADFYPRVGPTWEWDTGAGQAIVTAAGGVVLDFAGEPFAYNKKNLVNGPFLAASSVDWLRRTGILEKASSLAID
jgi:3'(2'), 5'-bisphosphate nucleotidase